METFGCRFDIGRLLPFFERYPLLRGISNLIYLISINEKMGRQETMASFTKSSWIDDYSDGRDNRCFSYKLHGPKDN